MNNPSKTFKLLRLYPWLSTDPVTGREGEFYYNTTTKNLRVCTGGSPLWKDTGITGKINGQNANTELIGGGIFSVTAPPAGTSYTFNPLDNLSTNGATSSIAAYPGPWTFITNTALLNDGILNNNALASLSDSFADNEGYGAEITYSTPRAVRAFKFYGYFGDPSVICDFAIEAFNGLTWDRVATIPNSSISSTDKVLEFNAGSTYSSTQWRWFIENWVPNGVNFYVYEWESYENYIATVVYGPKTLAWSANAFLRIPSELNSRNEISAGSYVLNDGESLYVQVNRSGVDQILTVLTATEETIPVDENTYVIARATVDSVEVDMSLSLKNGESSRIDQGIDFKAIQNASMHVVSGATFTLTGSNLSWDAPINVQAAGISNLAKYIPTGSIMLNVGESAYYVLDRTDTSQIIGLSVANIEDVPVEPNVFILATRYHTDYFFVEGNVFENGDSRMLYQAGGAASQWITSGSDIYYNLGKVNVGGTDFTGGKFIVESFSANGSGPAVSINEFTNTHIVISNGYDGTPGGNKTGIFFSSSSANGILSGVAGLRLSPADWTTSLAFYVNNITSGPEGTQAIQERMRLNENGFLGINTSSPVDRLHINDGGARIDGSSNPYLTVSDGSNNGFMQIAAGQFDFRTNTNTPISFATQSIERMRILSNGYVGIGTSTPDDTVHIASSTNTRLRLDAGSGSVSLINFQREGVFGAQINTATDDALWFYAGGSSAAPKLQIQANGDLTQSQLYHSRVINNSTGAGTTVVATTIPGYASVNGIIVEYYLAENSTAETKCGHAYITFSGFGTGLNTVMAGGQSAPFNTFITAAFNGADLDIQIDNSAAVNLVYYRLTVKWMG